MDYSLFAFDVTCTLISCAAAVVSVFNARKPVSVELQSNVDDLMMLVEKLLKDQRKEKMSRVRQGASDNRSDPAPAVGDQGGMPQMPPSKAELRARLRQSRGF